MAVAVLFAGCSTSATPPVAAPPQPLTRISLTAGAPTDPFSPADSFNKPAVGTRYVAVPVTITAREKTTVEPARWIRAKTRTNSTIAAAVVAAQPDDISAGGPSLGRLEAGGEISGILIYEVPLGDTVVALEYRDDLVPPQRGETTVP